VDDEQRWAASGMMQQEYEGNQQIPVAEHIYRYTFRSPRVFLNYIIAYPLTLAAIFIVNGVLPPHHFGLDPFVTSSSLVGMSIGLALITRRTTLRITPDGVLYQRPGRSTWAVWSDVEALRPWSHGYYGWTFGEGLVLRSDTLAPPGTRRGRSFSRYFIPLELFATRWWESPLGEDIRCYIPHLFTEADRYNR